MDFLCKVCDRSIIENESEYNNYLATLRKKMITVYIKHKLLIILIWMKLVIY